MEQDANSSLDFPDKHMGFAQLGSVNSEHKTAPAQEKSPLPYSAPQVDSEYPSCTQSSQVVPTGHNAGAYSNSPLDSPQFASCAGSPSGLGVQSASNAQPSWASQSGVGAPTVSDSNTTTTSPNNRPVHHSSHPIEVVDLSNIVAPVVPEYRQRSAYSVSAPAPEASQWPYPYASSAPSAPHKQHQATPSQVMIQDFSHCQEASAGYGEVKGATLGGGGATATSSDASGAGATGSSDGGATTTPAQAVVMSTTGFETTYDVKPEKDERNLKMVEPKLTTTDIASLLNLDPHAPIGSQSTIEALGAVPPMPQKVASTKSRRNSSDTSDLPLFGAEIRPADNELGDDNAFYTVVKVAVNYPLFTTFDYKIAGEFDESVAGCRVKISFGKNRSKKEIGIILGLQEHPLYDIRKIKVATLLDHKSLISPDLLQTLIYGAEYYHYPIGQILVLALPKLLREGGSPTYKEIPGLQSLVDESELDAKLESIRSLPQKELLIELKYGPKRRRELREQGFTSAQELALIKKGLIQKIDLSHKLLQAAQSPKTLEELYLNQPLQLNDEQKQALEEINAQDGYGIFLLNGVTGSGKTEVYLQVIAHTLMQGKKALVLVPEIALTPQTFKRFFHRFKVQIATLHSTLSDRERLDGFLDMYSERAMILIGTRSALFTPIPNLGLIVIDEEHDSSFKQNDGFRYHTRTLALHRAQLNNCKVVLGSATPSLDSLYQVEKGNYKMIFLKKRAHNSKLPLMQIVDLKKKLASLSMSAGVGHVLEELIGINSVRHRQSIIFINRRGYSHQMFCNSCEKVIQCPHCDVPMTVHRSLNMLICHICNTQMPIPQCCPYCGCESISENGVGTEQVEQYLKMRFMDVGIERVDRDTVASKADLEMTLDRIRSHKSEIIVGTQMLAKGHDFPDVTLVGILNVDSGLYSDDFRALEQTVQLVTQVAGRAGRASKLGRVIIQTMFPDHQILLRLTNPKFDYTELAYEMLGLRKAVDAPPYAHQAVVMANGSERDTPFNYLNAILLHLYQIREIHDYVCVTPVLPDRIEKKINRYHYHFIINCIWRDYLDKTLDIIQKFQQHEPLPSDVRFSIDVDPIISP